MGRRSSAGREPVKARRRKTGTLKGCDAQKAVRRRLSSAASLHEKVALLTRERDEAPEQQTATADVLRVISVSPGDLEAVFGGILVNVMPLQGQLRRSLAQRGRRHPGFALCGAVRDAYASPVLLAALVRRGVIESTQQKIIAQEDPLGVCSTSSKRELKGWLASRHEAATQN